MRWPKLSRHTLGYALVTSSCISKNISERLVEEVRSVFAEMKKRKSIKLDLIPSPGEVEGKGLLEVSFCSFEKKVERVLQRQKASAWMAQLSAWASTK